MNKPELTHDNLLELGFQQIGSHPLIGSSYELSLGNLLFINVGAVDSANETIFLYRKRFSDENIIEDIIVIRSYDYNGFTSVKSLVAIIESLKT